MDKASLFDVKIDLLDHPALIEHISQTIASRDRQLIMHVNIRGLNMAYELPWLRDIFSQADVIYSDGMGVSLGARLLGEPVPPRSTLADWVWPLAEMCAQNGFSMFLLGNPPGTAERSAENLKARFPSLRIVGTQHGFFDLSATSFENEAVIERINEVKPDLLLAGFGMPLQERWLERHWSRLDVRVAITCGALFEILAGDLKRGPKWMTDNYLEWLSRILITPGRVLPRYARDIPLFYYRIFKQKFNEK